MQSAETSGEKAFITESIHHTKTETRADVIEMALFQLRNTVDISPARELTLEKLEELVVEQLRDPRMDCWVASESVAASDF